MSLLEDLRAERRARLARLGVPIAQPYATKIVKKEQPVIDPVPPEPEEKPLEFSIEPLPWAPEQTIERIQDAVCIYFKLTKIDLLSPRRTPGLAYPRQVGMYLSRTMTAQSFPAIGRKFRRDYSTVIRGAQLITRRMTKEWEVAFDVAHLEAMLANG
jgi:chromosomal replication initiator protein